MEHEGNSNLDCYPRNSLQGLRKRLEIREIDTIQTTALKINQNTRVLRRLTVTDFNEEKKPPIKMGVKNSRNKVILLK